MYIVIFCSSENSYRSVSDKLLLGICDYVNCRTRHNRTVFEIDSKNIIIDIRPDNILKSAGLRPDYVLFYDTSYDFYKSWDYNMNGRYVKLKSFDDLIQLVIKEKENNND